MTLIELFIYISIFTQTTLKPGIFMYKDSLVLWAGGFPVSFLRIVYVYNNIFVLVCPLFLRIHWVLLLLLVWCVHIKIMLSVAYIYVYHLPDRIWLRNIISDVSTIYWKKEKRMLYIGYKRIYGRDVHP